MPLKSNRIIHQPQHLLLHCHGLPHVCKYIHKHTGIWNMPVLGQKCKQGLNMLNNYNLSDWYLHALLHLDSSILVIIHHMVYTPQSL